MKIFIFIGRWKRRKIFTLKFLRKVLNLHYHLSEKVEFYVISHNNLICFNELAYSACPPVKCKSQF